MATTLPLTQWMTLDMLGLFPEPQSSHLYGERLKLDQRSSYCVGMCASADRSGERRQGRKIKLWAVYIRSLFKVLLQNRTPLFKFKKKINLPSLTRTECFCPLPPLPKFVCWHSHQQSDVIWRWSLWEAVGSLGHKKGPSANQEEGPHQITAQHFGLTSLQNCEK